MSKHKPINILLFWININIRSILGLSNDRFDHDGRYSFGFYECHFDEVTLCSNSTTYSLSDHWIIQNASTLQSPV